MNRVLQNLSTARTLAATFQTTALLTMFVGSAFPAAGFADELSDARQITEVVQPFVSPGATVDAKDVNSLWTPDGKAAGQVNGKFSVLAPDQFLAYLRQAGDPKTLRGQIVTIDIAGTVAAVKVLLADDSNHRLTEFLALARRSGGWRIAGAVFDNHERDDRSPDYYASVDQVLNAYSNAFRTGDGDVLRPIWLDHARVVGLLHGHSIDRDRAGFCQLVTEVKAQPDFVARTLSVSYSGPAACARIEIKDWKGVRYTDFLLLYQIDGKWQISQKVFDAHDQAEK